MSSNLVLTEKRIVNDYPQMTWEAKDSYSDPQALELKYLRNEREKQIALQLQFEQKVNEAAEISSIKKAFYFAKLAILEIVVKYFRFFEIKYFQPLSCALKFSLKSENPKEYPKNPNSDPKSDPKISPEQRAHLMREGKRLKNLRLSEAQQLKQYLIKRMSLAVAVFNTELVLDGKLIRLIDLPHKRDVTAQCKEELNLSLGLTHDHKFYTSFTRRVQRLIEIEGTHFFKNTTDETI